MIVRVGDEADVIPFVECGVQKLLLSPPALCTLHSLIVTSAPPPLPGLHATLTATC